MPWVALTVWAFELRRSSDPRGSGDSIWALATLWASATMSAPAMVAEHCVASLCPPTAGPDSCKTPGVFAGRPPTAPTPRLRPSARRWHDAGPPTASHPLLAASPGVLHVSGDQPATERRQGGARAAPTAPELLSSGGRATPEPRPTRMSAAAVRSDCTGGTSTSIQTGPEGLLGRCATSRALGRGASPRSHWGARGALQSSGQPLLKVVSVWTSLCAPAS